MDWAGACGAAKIVVADVKRGRLRLRAGSAPVVPVCCGMGVRDADKGCSARGPEFGASCFRGSECSSPSFARARSKSKSASSMLRMRAAPEGRNAW